MKKKLLLFMVTAFSGLVAWGQCLPTFTSACTSGDFINSVTFNTISNLGTGCTNPSMNNYADYTAISTNVQQNTTYQIDVAAGPSWGQYMAVFIDFNNNGSFNDPGEFFDVGYAAAGATASNNILIPNGVPGGSVTMRVIAKYGTGTIIAGQSCNNFSYGECEDYTLNISAPLTDDAGIAEFVTPTLPTCSFTDSIRVAITNFGTDTLFSANIDWVINVTPMTTYNWTGALPPFATDTVNLGLFPLATGDALNAISSMPNGSVENPAGAYNDAASIASLSQGLNGIYTIGGITPDYATFAAAMTDINTFGLCGAVVFDIRDGVYNEQIDLTSVLSDATNNITFRSENGDASLVTLSYAGTSGTDNFVVNLNNTDYASFEDLTLENSGFSFGSVVKVSGGSDYNRFEDCHMHTVANTSTSTNTAVLYSNNGKDNGNEFINNIFEGGSYGAYWYGAGTLPTDLESGTVFDGNTFLDNYYYGARFERQDAPMFIGNSFIGESTYTGSRFAMYMNYCDNGFTATDNNIYGSATSSWRYGMYMINCDATNVAHATVANNMCQVGAIGNTSTFYAMYISNCGYTDIQHNSGYIIDGGVSSRAFYGASGGGNTLANNIFATDSSGYAIYLGSNYTLISSDNNLFHSPMGNVGYYGNANQATLADFQAASGLDANSVDMNPNFNSPYDLHVCNDSLKGLGMPLAIATDIDGQPRNAATPDMGADEFTDLAGNFLGSDVEICTGDVLVLAAGAPSDAILWSTGDTTTMINVTAPGTYFVTVTGACGIGVDTVDVTASALVYSGYLEGAGLEFCTGDSVLLYSNENGYDSYLWTGGTTNDSLFVSAGGTYTLDVTDGCGTGSESITVVENSAPTAGFTWTNSFVTGIFTNTSTGGGTAIYAWDFGDGNTSTEMNPTHLYSAAGTYTVTMTVTNDCGTSTFTNDIIVTTVGVEEIAGLGTITVYPNPSTGLFQLDVNLNESLTLDIVVTNMLGEEVAVSQINALDGIHSGVIDLTSKAPGVYFLNVISDNNTIKTQVLVKK